MREIKKSHLTTLFVVAWLLALGSSLYYLLGPEGGSDNDFGQASIAQIERSDGEVISRAEDAMVWASAGNGAKLRQGTHLATGDRSHVFVTFRDGRRLRLDAHTQIIISEEVNDGESNLVVSLVSGSLSAMASVQPAAGGAPSRGKSAVPMLIRSGGQTMTLGHIEDHLKLSNLEGRGSVRVIDASSGVKVEATKTVSVAKGKVDLKRLGGLFPDRAADSTVFEPAPVTAEGVSDRGAEAVAKEPPPSKDKAAKAPTAAPAVAGKAPAAPVVAAKAPAAPVVAAKAPAAPVVAAKAPAAHVVSGKAPAAPVVAASQPPAAPAAKPPTVAAVAIPPAAPPLVSTQPKEVRRPPPPPPPPPPPLRAKGLEPEIAGLRANRIYWTEASMRGGQGVVFPLDVQPPKALPEGATWQPFAKAEVMGQPAVTVLGTPGGPQTLTLKLNNLGDKSPAYVTVKLTLGAFIVREKTNQKATVEVDGPVLTLASLSDVATAGPIDVHLAPGAEQATGTGWWSKAAADATAPVTLHFAKGSDLTRLLPLLQGAKSLGVTPGGTVASLGWSYVKGDKIVATATGAALPRAAGSALVRVIAQGLEAALTFLGPPEAFLARPDGSTGFLRRIAEVAASKQQVYVYDHRPGDKHYAMRALTLTGSPDVATYVANGAEGIFSQPVDVLRVGTPAH